MNVDFVTALDKANTLKMKSSVMSQGGVPITEVLNLNAPASSSKKRKVSNCFVNELCHHL